MAVREDLGSALCPIARALGAVGDCWSLMIVRDIMMGRRRFNELQRSLNLARNTLTDRLRSLTELGILEPTPAADGTTYREYALTPKGADLYLVLAALRHWGVRWETGNGVAATVIVDRLHGRPIAPLELRADDGRTLGPADVAVVAGPPGGDRSIPRPSKETRG